MSTESTESSARGTTALSLEILDAWREHAREQYLMSLRAQATTQEPEPVLQFTLNSTPFYTPDEIGQMAARYISRTLRAAVAFE